MGNFKKIPIWGFKNENQLLSQVYCQKVKFGIYLNSLRDCVSNVK